MPATKKPLLLIIDTHALVHRAFHAYPPDLQTKRGEKTNALFGFSNMLLQVLKQFRPDFVIAASDSKEKTFRHKLYKEYKANRPEMDPGLAEQLPRIYELIDTAKIQLIKEPGYEADDIIGSVCKSPAYKGFDKIVVTGDRDLFQILAEDVKVYLAGGAFNGSVLYDTATATVKMGVSPDELLDFKALRGDSSDNIPGVKGIGDKTATDLITRFSSLENVYQHLDELKPAVKTKLEADKEMAFLSRELAKINTEVPVVLDLDNSELRDIDLEELRKLFDYYEFRSLSGKVLAMKLNGAATSETGIPAAPSVSLDFKSVKVAKVAELNQLIAKLHETKAFVFFTNKGEDIFSKPASAFIATGKEVFEIPLGEPEFVDLLRPVLESGRAIVYDAKKEIHACSRIGIENFKAQDDLMLMDYLLLGGVAKVDMESSVKRYLDIKIEQQAQQDLFSEDRSYTHAYQLLLLSEKMLPRFQAETDAKKWDLKKLYKSVELPLTRVLADMERRGIELDIEAIRKFAQELEQELALVQKEIFDLAGEEFNISSPKQLSQILFEKLQIPVGKKTKGGAFSTNEKVLLNSTGQYPIIAKVLHYRELFKLKSTYTEGLVQTVNKTTGRIHTSFNQAVAATGRLSSTNPNLQNIPTSTELGQKIRYAFVAPQGKTFVSFDYAQQELRLLAHFSQDAKLIESFVSGLDIHATTAASLFKVPVSEVSKAQRRVGKTVNFGVVYGISPFGLADQLKITNTEAQAFIEGFFASYPAVKVYFEEMKARARNVGYIETLYGRKRDASGLNNANFQARAAAEREIINFPLQGSAADIMKLAMLETERVIKTKYSDFAQMVLQVHDELIFEVSEADSARLTSFKKDITTAMAEVVKLLVPVNVSAAVAKNWGELK